MRKMLMIFALAFLLSLSFSSAYMEELSTQKQNTCIDLPQSCPTCSYVTLESIKLPNTTTMLISSNMTKRGLGQYNYSFCQTSLLGEYQVMTILDGNITSPYSFEVNESGESFGQTQAIIILAQLGVIALFFGIGITFKQEKWKVKSFFNLVSLFMGVILLNSIRILIGTSSSLAKMGSLGLILGIIVLSFMFLYLLIYYTIEVFYYFKEKRNMKWGVSAQ